VLSKSLLQLLIVIFGDMEDAAREKQGFEVDYVGLLDSKVFEYCLFYNKPDEVSPQLFAYCLN
jgi:hypothetical protein